MLEFYENEKCYFCQSHIIVHPIMCPEYGPTFTCNDGEACKYCVENNKEPNPDAYWCEDCHKGYDFKKHEYLPNKNHKSKQSTL